MAFAGCAPDRRLLSAIGLGGMRLMEMHQDMHDAAMNARE
jgi:hypothetical protein